VKCVLTTCAVQVGPKKDVMVDVDFPKEVMPPRPRADDFDMRKLLELAALLAQKQG
jgi:hypothetical protein